MFSGVVLGVVIRQVAFAVVPIDVKLFLLHPVPHPIEAHVHCFCVFGFDCVVDGSDGGGVVGFNGGGWLWVTKLLKGGSNPARFLAVEKQSSELRLGGAAHDVFQDVTDAFFFDFSQEQKSGRFLQGDPSLTS